MEFTPTFDNILVELENEETTLQTSEPIFTENGKVVAIGPDVKEIKIGDIIGMFKFGKKTITRNGKQYHTIRELPAFILGKYGQGN